MKNRYSHDKIRWSAYDLINFLKDKKFIKIIHKFFSQTSNSISNHFDCHLDVKIVNKFLKAF